MITLDNHSFGYGTKTVLHEISLQVEGGEQIAVIGPSGAGKSTLLARLYQLLTPGAAYIHQQYSLVHQLSVFHNIYMGRLDQNHLLYNLLNLIQPQRRELQQIKSIAEQLGLADLLRQRVDTLSGGQQQRVAVGRALYRGSPVILADEPVASIDPHQGATVLKQLMSTDRTTITALHSVTFAKRFATRIIGLKNGRLLFDAAADKVTEHQIQHLYAPC